MKDLTSWLEVTGMLLLGLGLSTAAGMLLPHKVGLSLALALMGVWMIGCSAVVNGWRPASPSRRVLPHTPVDQSKVKRVVSL